MCSAFEKKNIESENWKKKQYTHVCVVKNQWRKIRKAGGRVAPAVFHREIVDDLPGKERQGKKGKWRKEGQL